VNRDWRNVQRNKASEAAMSSRAFRPAHEHEWFNRFETVFLKQFAQEAQLGFGVVKHFTSRRIEDADLTWLVCKPNLLPPLIVSHRPLQVILTTEWSRI
jgi:hypothetical protein